MSRPTRSPSLTSKEPPPPPGGDPLTQLLTRLGETRRVQTQGLAGAGRGYALAQVSRALDAPLLCVTADDDAADALAADLAFFLGGKGSLLEPNVLRLPGDEVLPWDELSPDAGVVSERLAVLHHLRHGTPFRALVVSWRGLHRKVLPPSVMATLSLRLKVGEDRDRDTLARTLADMGYLSSPLVEDLGTFSVRGGIVDVFSPLYASPVRIELFGDTIESMRLFDPQTQRTVAPLQTLELVPAREVLFTEKTTPAAEAALRAAAERVDLPSTQLRERLEQVRERIVGFGIEALLPGFFEGGLSTLFDYLPFWGKSPVVYLDDPLSIERAAEEAREEIA
jgi:transcription-repair coupling factor (superfamily II helicase)